MGLTALLKCCVLGALDGQLKLDETNSVVIVGDRMKVADDDRGLMKKILDWGKELLSGVLVVSVHDKLFGFMTVNQLIEWANSVFMPIISRPRWVSFTGNEATLRSIV